jgi:hypothetical protein
MSLQHPTMIHIVPVLHPPSHLRIPFVSAKQRVVNERSLRRLIAGRSTGN